VILRQLVELVNRKEQLEDQLTQLKQVLHLARADAEYIDAAFRIVSDMEWTISQMQE